MGVNGGPATREQHQGQDVRWEDLDSLALMWIEIKKI